MEMDVKLCGARDETSWTEAALFQGGHEVCCSEPDGSKAVREWLASCGQRRHAPKFRFVDGGPVLDGKPAVTGEPMGRAKKAAYRIHMAGGCGATDEYAKGYDDAIALALDILLKETGLTFDGVMDYGGLDRD